MHKRENGFTKNTQKYQYHSAMKQSTHQFHKISFHISKCLACISEKNIAVEDNKKRMNIAKFINIYTYIICDENDSK